jgi:hypothetical protein
MLCNFANFDEMKTSNTIPKWMRNRLYFSYLKWHKSEFKNFETFLKHTLNEH